MRCPKCGYISFDRQRSCGKCRNDLTAVAEQLQGTVGKGVAPFFLGALLGRQKPPAIEPGPALSKEEEPLSLNEWEADTRPADQEELSFAGMELDDNDLEEQPLPSLNLGGIDLSDLVPPQEEAEEQVLSLGSEQEETFLAAAQEEEDSFREMDIPSFEPDDILNLDEEASFPGSRAAAAPAQEAEDEEIIDLFSLMGFEETPETPATPPERAEELDVLELSLGDVPEELCLTLENGENTAVEPKKPASAVADIPDLGLTLENDDR